MINPETLATRAWHDDHYFGSQRCPFVDHCGCDKWIHIGGIVTGVILPVREVEHTGRLLQGEWLSNRLLMRILLVYMMFGQPMKTNNDDDNISDGGENTDDDADVANTTSATSPPPISKLCMWTSAAKAIRGYQATLATAAMAVMALG